MKKEDENKTDFMKIEIFKSLATLNYLEGVMNGINQPPPAQFKKQVLENLELRILIQEQIFRREVKKFKKWADESKNMKKHFVYASKN